MKITKSSSVEEVAAAVTKILNKHKIAAVLTGRAVVSIYTENEYASRDLDFISQSDHSRIVEAMAEINFHPEGRQFFSKDTKFTVEFPTGPLALGDQTNVKAEGKLKIREISILLLSPTQCVMDRLSWFYHSRDRQALDQAVMVAVAQKVKLGKIEKWSIREGSKDKFEIFLANLKARKNRTKKR